MANEDSFINEVADEVRRERLFGYVRRYGWIAVTAVILLVGGAGFNEYRKARAEAAAQARGDAIMAALEGETPEDRGAALAGLEGEGEMAALLALLRAAEGDGGEDHAAALADLEQIAADGAQPPAYRDLAALTLVMLGGTDMAPNEKLQRLTGISVPGAPYRPLALEQAAIAHIEAGNPEAALTVLQEIVADGETSQGLRRRATQLIVALGGSQQSI